jgi:DNA-binding transcriptional LysR family regulator
MELRQLRYFIGLADEPDLTKAAKHAGLAPKVLLQHIAELEESLGCSLFRRHGEVLTVSAAGRVFYARAKELLEAAAAAAGEARAVAQTQGTHLRVGVFVPWLARRYAAAFKRFRLRHPQVQVRCVEMSEASIPAALRRNEIDLGFLEHVDVALRIELMVRRIEAMPSSILLPSSHALASRARVAMHELAGEPWVCWAESVFPGRRQLLLDAARAQGFHPNILVEAQSFSELVGTVASGKALAHVPRLGREKAPDDCASVPLAPSTVEFPVFIAWNHSAPEGHPAEELARDLIGTGAAAC